MPRVKTENVLSADNQQATPGFIGESPQRLYAKYPKSKKISEEEALLLGILYTDGCLSRNGKRCWRFYLSSTSLEIIHLFCKCITKFFGLDKQRVKISQKVVNGKPFYKAVSNSAYCGNLLIARYGTFRTLAFRDGSGNEIFPPTKLPIKHLIGANKVSSFLKAAFSCDGGVNLYKGRYKLRDGYEFLIRNVYLSCHHPQLQLDYDKLLKFLDIKSKILPKDNRIIIQGREQLQKFRDKVGFLEGVKITQHSAYWQGWAKNKVLNLAVSSYGNPRKILNMPQFLG